MFITGEDGVARLLTDIPADNWIPLAGFAFNNRFAGDGGGVEAGKGGRGEGRWRGAEKRR